MAFEDRSEERLDRVVRDVVAEAQRRHAREQDATPTIRQAGEHNTQVNVTGSVGGDFVYVNWVWVSTRRRRR